MNRHARLALMLFATWLSSVAMPACDAVAHEIRPAIVTLSFPDARRFEIDIKVNIEALIAKIGPVHKDTDESPAAAFESMSGAADAPMMCRSRVL